MIILYDILNRSITQEKLDSLLEMPRRYLAEDIVAAIPNLTMTNEGPVLTRVYVITKSFLCDVKISDKDTSEFDLIDRNFVTNIRVSKSQTIVNIGEDSTFLYKTATVRIVHDLNMESAMEFVGEERDEWLSAVLKLFPASLCIRHG